MTVGGSQSASDFECEIEDHDPGLDRTGFMALPLDNGGHCVVCEACLKKMFARVVMDQAQ